MVIDDLDFAAMYREHVRRSSRRPKPAAAWDKRSEEAARMCADPNDPYVLAFIARMRTEGAESLLDVGCGPGTICLPLARRFKKIAALDYSAGMLAVLRQRAEAEGANHIQYLQRSWDDDWSDVPVCDIVVASRSTMVGDMEAALRKLSAKARREVYTTHVVEPHFVAECVMQCLGRKAVGFPNYVYAVNLLYRMGYLPRLDYIDVRVCGKAGEPGQDLDGGALPGWDAFLQSVQWSIGELSNDEIEKLRDYYADRRRKVPASMSSRRVWAFLAWSVEP